MEYQYQVPTANMIAMVVTLLVSVGVPIAACIWAKRRFKEKVSLSSLVIGAAVFALFAMMLEQMLHMVVLRAAGAVMQENIWLYAIYGGLAAGIFEETGRFLGMKYFMKRNLTKENALMYGIGHGGFESIILVGMTYISNLMVSVTINNGGIASVLETMDEAAREATLQGLAPLWEMPSSQFYMAGIERICAFALQIALSYLVYTAVRHGRKQNYILAILFHAVVNAVVILLARVLPIYAVMAVLLVMVAGVGVYSVKLFRAEEQDFSKSSNTP